MQFVDFLLGLLQAFLNLPTGYLMGAWVAAKLNRGRPWLYFNYLYELWWVIIACVLIFVWSPRHWIVATIVLWRVTEILTWYIKLLFDKGHRVLLEVERNLLFLVIDLLMFVTLLAIILDGDGVLSAVKWSDAFAAFTLNGSPSGYEQPWASLVGILGAVGGITLIGAGLGMLVGLVGQRIKYGPGTRYTGPTLPAPPWKSRF